MFGSEIEIEMIKMFYNESNGDYFQTLTCLSEMIEQKPTEKKEEAKKTPKEPPKKEKVKNEEK